MADGNKKQMITWNNPGQDEDCWVLALLLKSPATLLHLFYGLCESRGTTYNKTKSGTYLLDTRHCLDTCS